MLDAGSVRFFIHATKSIISGAEITIAFDFNYHKWYILDFCRDIITSTDVFHCYHNFYVRKQLDCFSTS